MRRLQSKRMEVLREREELCLLNKQKNNGQRKQQEEEIKQKKEEDEAACHREEEATANGQATATVQEDPSKTLNRNIHAFMN